MQTEVAHVTAESKKCKTVNKHELHATKKKDKVQAKSIQYLPTEECHVERKL